MNSPTLPEGWKRLRQLELDGRTLFLRLDLNVPLADGQVQDTTRIDAVLPTLGHCLRAGAAVVAASHLGRPGGKPDPALSLQPVAEKLQTLLGWPVTFCPEPAGARALAAKEDLGPGDLLLLENLRFHPGETAGDEDYARDLAGGCQLYATDAFGVLHRAHASVVGVPRRVQDRAAGLLVEKELRVLGELVRNPARPFLVVLGGAKISTKMPVLRRLLSLADGVFLGGAMALTLLAARGEEMADSLVERESFDEAREVARLAEEKGVALHLPVDHRIETAQGKAEVASTPLPPKSRALDIGPDTVETWCEALEGAGTILWNGPLGLFERSPFDEGTLEVGRAIGGSGARTVVGGGDSVAAVRKLEIAAVMDHISTGGGAMLAYLAGETLPGLEALQR